MVDNSKAGVTEAEMFKADDTNAIIVERFADIECGGYLHRDGELCLLTRKDEVTRALYRFVIDYLHLDRF